MPNLTHLGIAGLALLFVGSAQVPLASSQEPVQIAQVTAPLVDDCCPKVTWAEGYRIGEMMPIDPSQHYPAVVISPTPLRSGYGFEGAVISNLAVGTRVTVTDEVWDMDCNQWTAVPGDQRTSFIHGNALLNL